MTIRQEDNREEETVVPSESQPELESTLVTWEKPEETYGIFVHGMLITAAFGTETNGFIRKAPNQNSFRLVERPTRENLTYLKDNWVHFITEDLSLDSDNNLVLLDPEAISQNELSKFNPQVGDGIVSPYRNRNIFSLVISANRREAITPKNLATCLKTLESKLRDLDIHAIRIGKCGEIIDSIPKRSLERRAEEIFRWTGFDHHSVSGRLQTDAGGRTKKGHIRSSRQFVWRTSRNGETV